MFLWPALAALTLAAPDADKDYDKLNGVWEVTAMIDGGELVPPDTIKKTLLGDGRLWISGQTISFIRPGTNQKRDLLFVLNSSASPKTLDVVGTEKVGSKGIYMFEGNTLFICLNGPDGKDRPAEFASKPGSHSVLMLLKKSGDSPAVQPAQPATPPAPPAVVQPAPKKDDEIRRALIGTWGHQTDDVVQYTTLNDDGSCSTKRTWKKAFQKVFHDEVRSSGTWKVENGVVIINITASTEAAMRNQVYSFRISKLYPDEVLYTDDSGQSRREWKTR